MPVSVSAFHRSKIQSNTIRRHSVDIVREPIPANRSVEVHAGQNLTNLKCFRFERYWSNDCGDVDVRSFDYFCLFVLFAIEKNVLMKRILKQFPECFFFFKTHDKSNIGSSQSPSIPSSLVPKM